jgi:hypothetical protein
LALDFKITPFPAKLVLAAAFGEEPRNGRRERLVGGGGWRELEKFGFGKVI